MSYGPPLDALLKLGWSGELDMRGLHGLDRDGLHNMGITDEHVPDLLEMIKDAALWKLLMADDGAWTASLSCCNAGCSCFKTCVLSSSIPGPCPRHRCTHVLLLQPSG